MMCMGTQCNPVTLHMLHKHLQAHTKISVASHLTHINVDSCPVSLLGWLPSHNAATLDPLGKDAIVTCRNGCDRVALSYSETNNAVTPTAPSMCANLFRTQRKSNSQIHVKV